MRIEILTTFPKIFDSYMSESMMLQAQKKGIVEWKAYDLRDWTHDVHRTTDDYIYGGGQGLVMKCEPIFDSIDDIAESKDDVRIVIPAPHGKVFDDKLAKDLSQENRLLFICGHYEGLDERVYSLADDIVSIGDYVLTSGELSTQVIIDAVVRKIPGVLGAKEGANEESFVESLLEYPQYTRPSTFRGMEVPDVLLSGDKSAIDKFNRKQSIKRTWEERPDLIEDAIRKGLLTSSDLEMLEEIKN